MRSAPSGEWQTLKSEIHFCFFCNPNRLIPAEKFFAELDHFKTKGINTKKRKSSNTENLKSASSLLELPYNHGKDAHQFASFPKKAVNFRTFDTTVITEQFNP